MTKHRFEIDYLRALAVLSVVIFHIIPAYMPGGFLGVDIFFVISGFLITSNEMPKILSGTFTFSDFYIRRFRRLFPALFVTVSVTVFIGTLIFDEALKFDLLNSAIASIFALSNMYFYIGSGYFDSDSILKPLLHTWSLGVEEQFYIMWPILLFVLLKFYNKFIVLVLSALILLSLLLSATLVEYDPNAAFFLVFSRMFQFLFGAIIAIVLLKTPLYKDFVYRKSIVVTLFLILLVGMFIFTEDTPMPGFAALIPTLATAIIIFTCHGLISSNTLVYRFIRHISRISYALYLVHWPVIVFINYKFGTFNPIFLALAMGILSYVLSLLLHHLIENPVRFSKNPLIWLAPVVTSFAFVIGVSTPIYSTSKVGKKKQFVATGINTKINCERNPTLKFCSADVLMIGDSHSVMYRKGLIKNTRSLNLEVASSTAPGCPPVFQSRKIYNANGWGEKQKICDDSIVFWEKQLPLTQSKVVFLAARWEQFLSSGKSGGFNIRQDYLILPDTKSETTLENSRKIFKKNFEYTLDKITAAGKRVIVMGQLPMQRINSITCARQMQAKTDDKIRSECLPVTTEKYLDRSKWINDTISNIADSRELVEFMNPADVLCDDRNCNLSIDNAPVYINNNHLNPKGGDLVLKEFFKTSKTFIK
jgi:peptidoglycan/LPS O-acetylase OafA/YrhL